MGKLEFSVPKQDFTKKGEGARCPVSLHAKEEKAISQTRGLCRFVSSYFVVVK